MTSLSERVEKIDLANPPSGRSAVSLPPVRPEKTALQALVEALLPLVSEEQIAKLSGRVERMLFETYLKVMRESRGLSMSELAELAGVSRTHIWQIENGKSSPTVEWLRKIASALGCALRISFVEKTHGAK